MTRYTEANLQGQDSGNICPDEVIPVPINFGVTLGDCGILTISVELCSTKHSLQQKADKVPDTQVNKT